MYYIIYYYNWDKKHILSNVIYWIVHEQTDKKSLNLNNNNNNNNLIIQSKNIKISTLYSMNFNQQCPNFVYIVKKKNI